MDQLDQSVFRDEQHEVAAETENDETSITAIDSSDGSMTATEPVARTEDGKAWSGIIDRYLHDGVQIAEYLKKTSHLYMENHAPPRKFGRIRSTVARNIGGRW